MTRLIADGHTRAVIVNSAVRGGPENDSTFVSVWYPQWTIFNWDPTLRGVTDEPLLGGLVMVGPTISPVPGFGLDIWNRLGAVQHQAYFLNFQGGTQTTDDLNQKRDLWEKLSAFA